MKMYLYYVGMYRTVMLVVTMSTHRRVYLIVRNMTFHRASRRAQAAADRLS